jgi:hypothetical protein
MPKTALAAALAVLILAAVTPTAQAMPMVPHHSVFAGLNADIQDAQSRRCWRDRWGRVRCRRRGGRSAGRLTRASALNFRSFGFEHFSHC